MILHSPFQVLAHTLSGFTWSADNSFEICHFLIISFPIHFGSLLQTLRGSMWIEATFYSMFSYVLHSLWVFIGTLIKARQGHTLCVFILWWKWSEDSSSGVCFIVCPAQRSPMIHKSRWTLKMSTFNLFSEWTDESKSEKSELIHFYQYNGSYNQLCQRPFYNMTVKLPHTPMYFLWPMSLFLQ